MQLIELGKVKSNYIDKLGTPRQPGIIESSKAQIIFDKQSFLIDHFRELQKFDRIWVIFGFHKSSESYSGATIRPPRLKGKRIGVFASRTPHRPNPIGMSCVKLRSIEQTQESIILHIEGEDMINETPVYDIKPYIPEYDAFINSSNGWLPEASDNQLSDVLIDCSHEHVDSSLIKLCKQLYLNDCRPHYHDEGRSYTNRLGDWDITWHVIDNKCVITQIKSLV